MLDFTTLHRDSEQRFIITDVTLIGDTEVRIEQELEPMFEDDIYNCPEAYTNSGIRGYAPMLAKELEEEEDQLKQYADKDNIIEEKFDGTRGLMYFMKQPVINVDTETGEILEETEMGYTRLFSRNISKKTGFYTENSDRLPQLREINAPDLAGTILDGELFIDGLPFKEVSSTLNCLWHEAVDRQIKNGFVSLHAFDIIKYRGIDMRKLPLSKRKYYLHLVIEELNSPYVKEVPWYPCGDTIGIKLHEVMYQYVKPSLEDAYLDSLEDEKEKYPELYKCYKNNTELTPKAYYELIVSTGGEGVIIKNINGSYRHKRGWEYSKIKAFLTRELIVIDFEEPTREYKGKNKKTWAYWEGNDPVTKHYYNKQVGNLILGVIITPEELDKIPVKKRGATHPVRNVLPQEHADLMIMEVCTCSGFDDDTREYFTRNRARMLCRVVEVKANGLFKDTGAMRHPRYLRMRPDKNADQCKWRDHVGL